MSVPLLSDKEVRAIAKAYDGTSETIDALVKKYRVARHNIFCAARKGGYKTKRSKIEWTPAKDAYLKENWGKLPPTEVYAHLVCSPSSVFNRLKRIGHSTRNNQDFTVYDIEHLTKIDHRMWVRFINESWLKSYQEYGRNGETWSRRIKVEWLQAFLIAHPEAFNYRAADNYTRGVLELNKLPDPPSFMRITCRSNNWQDGMRATPVGKKIHHGEVTVEQKHHEHTLESCFKVGGTDFWAPLYVTPSCPRCGCKATRFSEKAVFTDKDPGEGDSLNAIASKLGLTWRDGRFYTSKGKHVTDEELLRFVFSTKRNAGKAFVTFRRLLQAGMTITPPKLVPADRFLPPILNFKLRDGAQREALAAFLESGNVGIYWPPGIGKMYFLGTVYSRLAGEHFLFVHTHTIREQWIEFFRAHAPRANVIKFSKAQPYWCIELFDQAGEMRSAIRIYTYQTRHNFADEKPVVIGFDESQFLPGNNASRLSMVESEYRVGLSATPFREDGRGDLIQIMTGAALGEDWKEFKDRGEIADVPVRVVIVRNLEHKHRALGRYLNGHKTIVFSDAIEDGMRIQAEQGIPFVHAGVKNRLETIKKHRVVCASRVADCGIDIQDLEEVIEFNFHHGSRAQSLQRLGRLLHSTKATLRHTVMMTTKEFSLYHKRLSALEAKGFRISIEMHRDGPGRPPAPKGLQQWKRDLGVSPAASPPPRESTADKRARVMRRIADRASAA